MVALILLTLVCVTNFALSAVVLANNPRARMNRVLAGLALLLGLWSGVTFMEDAGFSQNVVEILVALDFGLAAVILWLYYELCIEVTRTKSKILTPLLAGMAVVNVGLAFAMQIVSVEVKPGSVVFTEQPLAALFYSYTALTILAGLSRLARRHSQLEGRERAQVVLIFFGLFLTATGVVVTNIVLPAVMEETPAVITRLGIYSNLFLTGFATYAIVKHRFLNVRMVVARTLAYVLLLTSLAGLYGGAIFAVTQLFFGGNSQLGNAERITYVVLAILLAFTFQPLRRFFERLTDRIFYRDRYDSQELLNNLGRIIVNELELDATLNRTLEALCAQMRIATAQVLVYNHGRVAKIEHVGALPQRIVTRHELSLLAQPLLVADELPAGETRDLLESHGVRVSVRLETKDRFVGYLLLGDKLSGDIYSAQDLNVLQIFGQELAVAAVNALAYEEIARFNITLQQKVESATKRLKRANKNLKALDKTKDEFLSMASHQLRTPLTSIKGYVSMIMEGDVGQVNPQQAELLGYAYDSSQRMVGLISDLLNVSRMSAGRFVIQREATDMAQLIRQEVTQLQPSARNKQITLMVDLPSRPLPAMMLDPGKTRQVVMNFLDNAIYYTPRKGQVTIKLRRIAGRKMRLEVRDTGIGVPDIAQKQLFQKFYRAENAKVARPDGNGLGLFLAKRVIEDQGGTIVFKSTEGKGSTFGFELPITLATKQEIAPTGATV